MRTYYDYALLTRVSPRELEMFEIGLELRDSGGVVWEVVK